MWQGLKLGDLVSSLKLSLNFLPFSLLITLLLPATIAGCLLAMALYLKKIEPENKCKSVKDSSSLFREDIDMAGSCMPYRRPPACHHGSLLLVISQSQLRCSMPGKVQICKNDSHECCCLF